MKQKELDAVKKEFDAAAIPAEQCHYCKVPIYRLPFQDAPKVDGKFMCLQRLGMYAEYQKHKHDS